jgi:hypothetical protein
MDAVPSAEQQRGAASRPRGQFEAQLNEERKRLWNADPTLRELPIPPPIISCDSNEVVRKNIENCWKEQGIWKDEWDNGYLPGENWKHEEPLELEAESETDSEAEAERPFGPKSRRPKSDEELLKIAERRVIREREREASRPYHQFHYQVSKERERIEIESGTAKGTRIYINTFKARENVKNTWVKRGIWDQRWVTLPGMSWMHEAPFEEISKDAKAHDISVNRGKFGALFGNNAPAQPPASGGWPPAHRNESPLQPSGRELNHPPMSTWAMGGMKQRLAQKEFLFQPLGRKLNHPPRSTWDMYGMKQSDQRNIFGPSPDESNHPQKSNVVNHELKQPARKNVFESPFPRRLNHPPRSTWDMYGMKEQAQGNIFGPSLDKSNHSQKSNLVNHELKQPARKNVFEGPFPSGLNRTPRSAWDMYGMKEPAQGSIFGPSLDKSDHPQNSNVVNHELKQPDLRNIFVPSPDESNHPQKSSVELKQPDLRNIFEPSPDESNHPQKPSVELKQPNLRNIFVPSPDESNHSQNSSVELKQPDLRNIFEFSPDELNHSQKSSVVNHELERCIKVLTDPFSGEPNYPQIANYELKQPDQRTYFEPSPDESNSSLQEFNFGKGSPAQPEEQCECQKVVPASRTLSPKNPSKSSTPLGPVHSTNVSKPARKKLPHVELNISVSKDPAKYTNMTIKLAHAGVLGQCSWELWKGKASRIVIGMAEENDTEEG